MRPLHRLLIAACALAVPLRAVAGEYTVFDDRTTFEAALAQLTGTSAIDSGDTFAADPATGGGNASVHRAGSVAGAAFAYDLYDLQFANSPTGTISPGVVGGDTGATSTISVESPASQSGATGTGSWGVDSGGVSTSRRSGLLADFTTTPGGGGIGHFGVDLVDFEVEPGTPGELRLYAAGALVFSTPFDFGAGGSDGQVVFLGVMGNLPDTTFDQVAILTGNTTSQWAADRFTFGIATNPEPGTWALFGLGVLMLAGVVRRRRASPPGATVPLEACPRTRPD